MVACSTGTPVEKTDTSQPNKVFGRTDEKIFLGDTEDLIEKYYHPHVIMKRGEAFFDKEEYAEALVEYNHFLDLHRTHVLAPYAAFRIGETYMKTVKTIDRDPEPIQKAITALEQMRKDFPGSRYDTQAQEKIQECHEWLAQMHLFVGQFYYRRGSYLAAAHRFEQIMQRYPDKPVAPDALYFLAMTYHDLGADDWARDNLVLLAEKYPGSEVSSDGKSLLAKLGGAQPGTLLAKKSDSIAFSDIGPLAGRSASSRMADRVLPPSPSQLGSLHIPSANALNQGFTACRLGAWC
jgi:outer membrane protein assembly factor BamD